MPLPTFRLPPSAFRLGRPPSAFRLWTPVAVWTAVIFILSSDLMAAPHTGSFLQAIIKRLLGRPLSKEHFELLHFVIRKCAHFCEYGILSGLLFRAIRGVRTGWSRRWALQAIAASAFVASMDEWWQSFVPSRSGAPVDVLIDTAGAAAAQVLIRAAQVLFFSL